LTALGATNTRIQVNLVELKINAQVNVVEEKPVIIYSY